MDDEYEDLDELYDNGEEDLEDNENFESGDEIEDDAEDEVELSYEEDNDIDIKKLNKDLENILARIKNCKGYPRYIFNEKKTVNTAQNVKNKEIKTKLKEIKNVRKLKIINFFKQKIIQWAPHIFWIFIIILIVIFLLSIGYNLEDKTSNLTGENPTQSSVFGITGKDFYGARFVYIDEEKSKTDIIDDYAQIISATIQNLEDENLDITFEMPEYNYSNFNENDFASNYIQPYAILQNVTQVVFEYDNPDAEIPSLLLEKASQIKYFGLDSTINSLFAEQVYNYINENNLYTQQVQKPEQEIESAIQEKVIDIISNYQFRTEKLYIKDYILSSDKDELSNINQENYVAMIYLPKAETKFDELSFMVSLKDNQEFEILFSDWTFEKEELNKKEEITTWIYSPTEMKNVDVLIYEGFDVENKEFCKTEKSLFDILNNYDLNALKLLESVENVYTFNSQGLIIKFQAQEKFFISEYMVEISS